tara:strand:+ start:2843 stop:4228 length:1386 start_codon:yes stop_codon:yes gene_type:complete
MSKFCPSRRRFLVNSLLAGTGVAAFGGLSPLMRLARAEAGSDRYYIFCYFSGAWDVLLSLDPRDPNVFHEGNVGDTLINPAYSLLDDPDHILEPFYASTGAPGQDILVGPYMGDLVQHMDKVAIIRGMSMETLTHEAGRRRFITGKAPSGLLARGSSAATWLASYLGGDDTIPNLSIRVESYNRDLPNYASALKVGSVPDLVRSLEPGPSALGALEERQVDELLARASLCPKAVSSSLWQASESARNSAATMIEQDLAALFDFQAASSEMAALRDHYDIGASGQGALSTPQARAATAVTAITEGISRVVSIQVASGLDTHYDNWTTDNGPIQEAGFNVVSRMIEDLQSRPYGDGSTWLDHTTIIGFSEFSRTALVNANSGRDHSLTNACFLAGGGVRGGQVIGASSDVGMEPTQTDLLSGSSAAAGEVIKPEHVIQALLNQAGISGDPADLRVDPLVALFE